MSDFTKSKLSRSDNYATPEALYKSLDDEFHFNDDPCPFLNANSKLFLEGLSREWNTSVFLNPPYSKPLPWIEKAISENKKNKTIVMLLRMDTSTKWFKLLQEANAKFLWINGRLRFRTGKPANFPSMIVILNKEGYK